MEQVLEKIVERKEAKVVIQSIEPIFSLFSTKKVRVGLHLTEEEFSKPEYVVGQRKDWEQYKKNEEINVSVPVVQDYNIIRGVYIGQPRRDYKGTVPIKC